MEDSLTVPSLPWSKTVEVDAREGVLFIVADVPLSSQPPAADLALGCRITVNGMVAVAEQAMSPGWFAHCSTTLQRVFKASTAPV